MELPSDEALAFFGLFLGILCVIVAVGEFRRRRPRRAYSLAFARDYSKAIPLFDDLIVKCPGNAAAYAGRGACYMGIDEWQKGIDDCLHAVSLGLNVHENFGNLGWAYYRWREFDNAIVNLSKAIDLRPHDPEYYRNRGCAHFELKAFSQAAADFTQVIRLSSDDATAYLWRGYAYRQLEDFPRAIVDFTEAIARCPGLAEAHLTRGDLHYRIANVSAAVTDGSEALRLAPNDPRALNLVAWIEATCPVDRFRNGAAAVEKARRACELAEPKEWYHVGTLAAALAEAGQFDEAIRFAREVLTMAPADELTECEGALAAYERGEPRRDDPLTPTQTPRQ